MIEIKSLFTDWHETDRETAKKYVAFLMKNIVNMREDKREEYINNNRIRGIKVEELLH